MAEALSGNVVGANVAIIVTRAVAGMLVRDTCGSSLVAAFIV
jgi:hypothetical protein